MVPPKPSLTDLTTSASGMPERMPKAKAVMSSARNGCICKRAVAKMMKAMLRMRRMTRSMDVLP